MPNKNYVKGKKKEYKIIFDEVEKMGYGKYKSFNEINKKGDLIVIRSAGSHSPIDVVIIDKLIHVIKFFQSKPDNFSEKNKEKIKENLNWLNNPFRAEFEVR